MKKIFSLIFVLACFSINYAFAQNAENATQVLLPLEVYVGDQAEIRYTFRTAVDLFPNTPLEFEYDINISDLPFSSLEKDCTVKKASFSRNDMDYTISIMVVPWRNGMLEFPEFDLLKLFDASGLEGAKGATYYIALEPIEIKSIVEKTKITVMQPPVPPLIIPGTTYVIFLLVLISVVLLFSVFRLILNTKNIRRKWKRFLIRHSYWQNAKNAVKKIKRLVKNTKLSDIEFCAELQSVTRNYLENRFGIPFSSVSASALHEMFERIALEDMDTAIAFCVEDLCQMFIRTDYIRYAHDSIDSQLYPPAEHQAVLVSYERVSLSDMVLKAIDTFENYEAE